MIDQAEEFNNLVAKQGLISTVKNWWKEHGKTLPADIIKDWDFDTWYKIFNSTKPSVKEGKIAKKVDHDEMIALNDLCFAGMEKIAKTFVGHRDICRELIDFSRREKHLQEMWNLAKNFDDYLWICRLAKHDSQIMKDSFEKMKGLSDTPWRKGEVLAIAYSSGDPEMKKWADDEFGKITPTRIKL